MKKKKAAGILALSACMVLGISGSAAADWTPADISEAVGYYSTDEGSLVLMSSGTMYAINAETGEMGTSSYEAYRDGGNLMLVSEEKKAVLVPQKEKGKTESGGSYYAFYQDYEGDASEVEFREGKHVQFGDEIFGNDYAVMVREPLSVFFNVDGSAEGIGGVRTEGSGYETPEEAVSAYVEALCNNDVSAMMRACAVESYVENYSLEKYVERLGALIGGISQYYLPDTGKLSEEINIEHRKGTLVNLIKGQYLTLTSAEVMEAGERAVTLSEYDSASSLLQDMFSYMEPEITYEGEILPPVFVISANTYYSLNMQKNILKQRNVTGAQKFTDRAAVVYVNGEPGLLLLGICQYNDRWFVTNNSMLANMIGLRSTGGGAVMFGSEEAESSLDFNYDACHVYQRNTSLQEAVNRLTEALEEIDMESILSLPEEEQNDAYEEELSKIENLFDDQEIAMIEQQLGD